MKTFVQVLMAVLITLMGCTAVQSEEIAQLRQELTGLRTLAGPPPSSLDNLYPPKAPAPLYQIAMFRLDGPLTGIALETERGNFELARMHFKKFQVQYIEVSRMVPEWEDAYPLQPLEDLRTSLEMGDRGSVMTAFGSVIKACNDCHFVNMPKVQQRYHCQDSSGIVVQDPVTEEDLNYTQLMAYLNMSFTGIGVELEQGKPDNAVKQFESFAKRFQVLKETCGACHETERKYYVDENVQSMLDKLGSTLRSLPPDTEQVGELSRQIGTEGCMKCHWVHIPAAYSKINWKN